MVNTIWTEWYNQNRFLGKLYPFIDNIPIPQKINEEYNFNSKKGTKKKSKLEKKSEKII